MVEKVDLIATRSMTYATRRLVADDLFQASRRDARLLVAIGKARRIEEAEKEEAPAAKPKAGGDDGGKHRRTRKAPAAKPKAG